MRFSFDRCVEAYYIILLDGMSPRAPFIAQEWRESSVVSHDEWRHERNHIYHMEFE